jgi:exodeoxyribonuclease VII large subunit
VLGLEWRCCSILRTWYQHQLAATSNQLQLEFNVPPNQRTPSDETLALFDEEAVAPSPPRAQGRARRPQSASAEPGLSPESAISIATLTLATRDIIEGAVEPLWVRGEVVGLKEHRKGHWYFTLKDENAQIRCVMWATDARRALAAPDEGMTIIALGKLTVFAGRGELQLRILRIDSSGDGLWRKAFEKIHKKLEAEGLFAPERKRPLPLLPMSVAVVTSADGAALHDIVSVIRRRCPITEVIVVHATVQGEGAASSIVTALHRVARWGKADVVILGRGGGSREDLWAFNDERVVRAAAGMPVPLISAVGHEIDVTLCDLAADQRAATPSAAAEAAVPRLDDLVRHVQRLGAELRDAALWQVASARKRLIDAGVAVARSASHPVERRRLLLEGMAGRLHALSPLATLARGYAVLSDDDGAPITSIDTIRTGDSLVARLKDGRIHSRVVRTEALPVEDVE